MDAEGHYLGNTPIHVTGGKKSKKKGKRQRKSDSVCISYFMGSKNLQQIKKIVGEGVEPSRHDTEKHFSVYVLILLITESCNCTSKAAILAHDKVWDTLDEATLAVVVWSFLLRHGERQTHTSKNTSSNAPGPGARRPAVQGSGWRPPRAPTSQTAGTGRGPGAHSEDRGVHPVLCYKDGDLCIL